jgi:FkbM family methyltransferase
VEANPKLLPVLQGNRDRNGCEFEIVHSALAYGGGTVEFGLSETTAASSLSAMQHADRIVVPTTSLASVLQSFQIERCNVVCDIEGAELELTEHEQQTLRERVGMIILEVHPAQLAERGMMRLEAAVASAGFKPRWTRGDVWVLENGALPPSPDGSGR